VHIPASLKTYFQGLREICDANGWLLMLDEVQSGIARTGTWFAFQHTGIVPDVMTLAKGLGSGVPIGACVARGAAADTFSPGKHGSTFGGNPLATAAGLATLNIIAEENLRENAETVGNYINQLLTDALKGQKGIVQIRNAGMMIGVELDRPCAELVKQGLAAKILINVTSEKVIRLLPSLVMTKQEAEELVNRLAPLILNFLKASA
jgi:acetylornithine aminotransferase